MRTLLIDHALFQLGGAAVIRTGGTISLVGGAAVGTQPGIQLRIRGGEVRLSDASWRIHTALESGAFVFGGTSPVVLGPAALVATGGDVVWRNADTLLVLVDSTSVTAQRATFTLETRAVFSPASAVTLPQWFGDLRFFADSTEATSLTLYSATANVSGAVSIVELVAPMSGTAVDLIRLENGATLTGSPTMGTAGYTLLVNPEAGVGLRAVKN